MNELRKLSPDAQIILGATLLYVVNSFLDWQQYCASFGGNSACAGRSEWHGIGVVAALFAIALLIWEINRMLKLAEVPIDQALVSVGAAVTLLVLTVLTFLVNNEFRHWPQWVGLILSIVIVVMAVRRGRSEGVQMPTADSIKAMGGGTAAAGATTGAAPPPAEPSAPPGATAGGPTAGEPTAGTGDPGETPPGGAAGEKPPEA
jgi:hypothetical protein